MTALERALQIALQAHAGQKYKDRTEYVLHPIRVMLRCTSEEARIAALLHDVVEDSATTLSDLQQEGFAPEIVEAVRLLTHEDGVSDEDYLAALRPYPIAREVKLADLSDNSQLPHLASLDAEEARKKLLKYHQAFRFLTGNGENEQ